MRVAVIALTTTGLEPARRISSEIGADELLLPATFKDAGDSVTTGDLKLRELTAKAFAEFDALIMVMALGIVVRLIAPHLRDKYNDPAVVVVDEGGQFAISALSGHEGGANELAVKVASVIGAEPVITTASESAKRLVVGVGCRKNITAAQVLAAVTAVLEKVGSGLENVKWLASIELKKNEAGLTEATKILKLPIRFFSAEEINNCKGDIAGSSAARRHLGVEGVCEPCAILASGGGKLIAAKLIMDGVTVAVAARN